MKTRFEELVSWEPASLHKVLVVVYPLRRQMIRVLREGGFKQAREADAACVQHRCLIHDDDRLAEVHFSKDHLTVGNIAHECLHASFHRLSVLGVPLNHADYEERLATFTGDLTDQVMKMLRTRKVPILVEV